MMDGIENPALRLLYSESSVFATALSEILKQTVDAEERASLFIHVLRDFAKTTTLEPIEKERRLLHLLKSLALSGNGLQRIALALREIDSPGLRNAITRVLDPELKLLVFAKEPVGAGPHSEVSHLYRSPNSTVGAIPATPITSPTTTTQALISRESADVMLLSLDDDPASAKLLATHRFTPLRYSNLQDAQRALQEEDEFCGCVIETSFLSVLSIADQKKLFSLLASYSTFIWLKVNETGLKLTRQSLFDVISDSRCSLEVPSVYQLALSERGGVQERDLESLNTARQRLSNDGGIGLFVPGELNDSELKLLVAALADYASKRRFRPKAALTSIRTKFLQAGNQNAKVAMIRVNDFRIPLVVKIASGDSRMFILDEIKRFQTFIRPGDKELNPEIHLHGHAALIIFGLIDNAEDDQEPAPTLDQILSEYWYAEMFGEDVYKRWQNSRAGFCKAVRKFSMLNQVVNTDSSFECKANPYLDSIKQMERGGFDWGLGEEAREIRCRAEMIFSAASQAAIAQGDAHSRNVLLRGQDGFVIDYAYSGPGHPCVDLVRLELSLFLTHFVQCVSEDILVQLQREITYKNANPEDLVTKYPKAFPCGTNRACMEMCLIARDAVGGVLAKHRLGWKHYVCTKLLYAWQALQIPTLQRSLVRIVIQALNDI
jgi:hypothetical protein